MSNQYFADVFTAYCCSLVFLCFVLLGSLTRSSLDSNMSSGQNSVPVELRINNFLLLKELLNS